MTGLEWEVVVPARAEVAERPVWDDLHGCLVWVEVTAGRVHRYRPGVADEIVTELDIPVGAAGLRVGGGYVLAAADGFRLVDRNGRPEWGPVRPGDMPEDVRFNDGACDPAGRFWAGTVAYDGRRGGGGLYRLDPDGSVHRILTGVTESNGLGWSPDGETFYYVDSGEPRVRAFRYDPERGTLGASRDLVALGREEGIPDGLAVDEDGCIWLGLWEGAAVHRYSSSGGLLDRFALPVTLVTCPGFGGADLEDLYVASAWEGMSEEERAAEPLAGDIFRARAGVRGLSPWRYAS